MVRTADPIGAGFIVSLARPGRNITGLTNINVDLSGKYLELLQAATSHLSRVAVLANPANQTHATYVQRIASASQSANVRALPFEARTEIQIDSAFATMKRERAEALILLPDPFFYSRAGRIAEIAIRGRLPNLSGSREVVEAGGLMSYGQSVDEQYDRAATYIDKILKGAMPAGLPVEQPTKLEFVVNRTTARAIGLSIPERLLLRADAILD